MAAGLIDPSAAASDRRAGAFVHDLASGRCVFCSAGFATLHGLPIEICRTLPPDERVRRCIHPDDQPGYRAEVEAARREGRAYSVAYRLLRPDGAVLHLEETAEPWDDPATGTRRLVGFIDDVTARAAARAELERLCDARSAEVAAAREEAERAARDARAAHERFFAAAESLADGLAIYDADDRLVYFNHRYRELASTGFREAMALGRPFGDIVRDAIRIDGLYHPDMGDELAAERLAHRERSAEDREFRIADGRWLRVRENALPDGGRVLLVHDISGRRKAMLELEEREERLRAIADGIPMPLVIARLQQPEILFANGDAARTFGLRIGPQPDAIRHAYVERDARRRLIERLILDGEVEGFEAELRRADGSTMWAMLYARMIPVAGELVVLIAVSDISERKAAQDQLVEREEQFRTIAEGVPLNLVIARLDPPEVLYANARATESFGLGPGAAGDAVVQVYDDPAERARVIDLLEREGRVDNREVLLRRADGSPMWALLSARLLSFRGERAMLTTSTDISERRAAEQALRESEARLSTFVAHSPIGMYLKSADGRYELVPESLLHAAGRTRPEVLGRTVRELFDDDYAALVEARDRDILETGRASSHEEYVPKGDGRDGWSMVIRFPISDARGVITHIGGFHIDITERRAMEEALRESEARLAAFMQNAPIGMFLKDVEGRYLLANPEMSRFFGTDAALMIGRVLADAPAGSQHGTTVAALDAEVAATGRVLMNELATERDDGVVWDLIIRFPIRGATGEVTAIAGFDVDISDRKAMEEALKASERRFKVFAEAHPVPVVISRLDGQQIIFASPPFLRLFRASLEDLAQGRLERFYEEPEMRRQILDRVAAEGELLGLEVRLRRADGEIFWGSFSSRLIEYEGAPAVVSSVIDVTERKRVEQQLRESEQRFRILAEAHPVPLMIVGVEDGIVMVASPACGAFFGLPTADFVGRSILPFYVDPAERAQIMQKIRREKRLAGYEIQMKRADGTSFWAAFDSRLIEFGGRLAVVAAYVDLTEKKAAEAELERQREALMQSEKMSVLGSLLASVAHELNNPLSVVVGQAAMLEELATEAGMAQRANKIRAAGDRCARIVRTFLAMARSKPPELREVSLNDLVRAALELTVYGLRSSGVVVDLELADDLPPLSADGDQLHQVLANLIVNAKQAMQGIDGRRVLQIRTALRASRLRSRSPTPAPASRRRSASRSSIRSSRPSRPAWEPGSASRSAGGSCRRTAARSRSRTGRRPGPGSRCACRCAGRRPARRRWTSRRDPIDPGRGARSWSTTSPTLPMSSPRSFGSTASGSTPRAVAAKRSSVSRAGATTSSSATSGCRTWTARPCSGPCSAPGRRSRRACCSSLATP